MCKVAEERPRVKENGWYNTTDTIKHLGMPRTTFWRKMKAGLIKGQLRKIDNNFWYRGKEILRFYDAVH